MIDLIIDPQIRGWVFLPIVVITFLFEIMRNYLLIIMTNQKQLVIQEVQDSQTLIRATLLTENYATIPNGSFRIRKHYFNNEETGLLNQKRPPVAQNMMTDPNLVSELVKGNITNVLPTIVIGSWINWMFSGFITTKVPFALTLRFKPMLQREIELAHLDASWVSSASWYFLNVFGLKSVYSLLLDEVNWADQTQQMKDQMSGTAVAVVTDTKLAFKTAWETLEIVQHEWRFKEIEIINYVTG